MAQLYRKSALEKISSPDQLDKALKVTSGASWLVLLGITLIIAVTVVWSVVGTIPTTVSAPGIISSPVGTNAVYAGDSGKVVAVLVREGSEVHLGDVLISYQTGSNEIESIYSDQVGTVSQVLVKTGDSITQGNEVIRVSPHANSEQVAVCYIPLSQARKIARGMQAQIYVDSVDSQANGHMVGRVINVDARAASTEGMGYVLGSNNNLAATYQRDGAVVAVACEFYPDETESGYYWTNEKGGKIAVTNGSSISVKVVTEEVAPITKLFSKLKEIWGE